MKNVTRTAVFAFLLSLFFASCTRDPLEKVVFVEDGKTKVTAVEVKDAVLLMRKIQEFAGKPIKDDKFVRWANSTAFRTVPGILGNTLLKEEFDRRNIVATPESDAKVLASHNRYMRKKAKSKEELAADFGELKNVYLRQFDIESRKTAYLDSVRKATNITDAEVDAEYKRKKSLRESEDAVYKFALRKGQKACEKLDSGVCWDDVAAEYNEDVLLGDERKDFWKKWDTIPRNGAYIYDDVAAQVRQLKDGEHTKPIETDGGLIIVKAVKSDEASIDCARILIRLPYFTEVPGKEQLKGQMLAEAVNDNLKDLLKELQEKHDFNYPMGTNITYEIFK